MDRQSLLLETYGVGSLLSKPRLVVPILERVPAEGRRFNTPQSWW